MSNLGLELHFPFDATNQTLGYFEGGKAVDGELGAQLFQNLDSAMFDRSRDYAQREADPPLSQSMEDFLLSEHSGLYDNLPDQTARDLALRLVNSFSGYSGAEHKDLSLR